MWKNKKYNLDLLKLIIIKYEKMIYEGSSRGLYKNYVVLIRMDHPFPLEMGKYSKGNFLL